MQNASNTVLIIDIGNPAADGKLHDRTFLLTISHTLLPIYELVKTCAEKGIVSMTPDVFLQNPKKFEGKKVLLISSLVNEHTDALIEAGATPFLLTCQESPFIATRFYLDFTEISSKFKYTMAFSGMRKKASSKTKFLTTYFPIYTEGAIPEAPLPFSEKKSVMLLADNKSARTLKTLPLKFLYGMSIGLIYPFRKKVVTTLARHNLIDIYGRGWDEGTDAAVRKAFLGNPTLEFKKTMRRKYKFTLAFENAIFPGYITEKIFDALLSRSIPIYIGDPEITSVVPKECFIDMREFKNENDLPAFLECMSEDRYKEYLAHIETFLASDDFKRFTHTYFIDQIYDLITKE